MVEEILDLAGASVYDAGDVEEVNDAWDVIYSGDDKLPF
jgi:hypothetical protein